MRAGAMQADASLDGAPRDAYADGHFSDAAPGRDADIPPDGSTDGGSTEDGGSTRNEWVRVVTATTAKVEGVSFAQGRVLVAGHHRGALDFAGTPRPETGSWSTFVGSFDLDGNPQWVRAYGSTSVFLLGDLAADATARTYALTYASGTITFDDVERAVGSAQRPILIVHDATGGLREERVFTGTGGNAQGRGLGASPAGRFALSGFHGGDIDLGGGFVGAGPSDAGFAGAFGVDRAHVWSFGYVPGSESARAVDADVDDAGTTCIVGQYDGDTDLGDGTARPRIGGGSGFIASYDQSGGYRWAIDFGTSTGNMNVYGVERLADDSCVMTGRVQQGVLSLGELSEPVSANDLFVARVDHEGVPSWLETGGGAGDDRAWAVSADSERVYATGYFEGTATIGGTELTAEGGDDAFLAVYALTDGTPLGATRFGSPGEDWGTSVVAVPGDGVVVGGHFAAEGTFGTLAASPGGATAGFVYRFWP